jgi:hypothetical protein
MIQTTTKSKVPEVEYTIIDLKSKRRIILNSRYQIISDTDKDTNIEDCPSRFQVILNLDTNYSFYFRSVINILVLYFKLL